METIITFTPAQLVGLFLTLCGGIVAVSSAVGVIVALVKKVKSPNDIQNARLDGLEKKVEEHSEILAKDKTRFEVIEEGNRVVQRALLALLAHGIDGNDIDAMKSAKDELTNYLIKR